MIAIVLILVIVDYSGSRHHMSLQRVDQVLILVLVDYSGSEKIPTETLKEIKF